MEKSLTEDSSALHLDENSLGSEGVDSVALSDEQSCEFVRILRGVDVLGESEIDVVVGDWDVGLGSSLELKDESLEVDDVLKGQNNYFASLRLPSLQRRS